jgi:methylglyoxal synthase
LGKRTGQSDQINASGERRKMRIAIIAHDNKKADIVAFVMKRLDFFKQHQIVATGTTGTHLEHAGLSVDKKKSGPQGGDAQIAAEITNGYVDGVIFFIDPLTSHAHEVDVQMLLRLCNVYNIPIATNYATASLLIKAVQINQK